MVVLQCFTAAVNLVCCHCVRERNLVIETSVAVYTKQDMLREFVLEKSVSRHKLFAVSSRCDDTTLLSPVGISLLQIMWFQTTIILQWDYRSFFCLFLLCFLKENALILLISYGDNTWGRKLLGGSVTETPSSKCKCCFPASGCLQEASRGK